MARDMTAEYLKDLHPFMADLTDVQINLLISEQKEERKIMATACALMTERTVGTSAFTDWTVLANAYNPLRRL